MMSEFRFLNGETANRLEPHAPFSSPIMVNDRGEGFFPHGFYPELAVMMPICRGLGFGWAAAPEVGGVLLSIFGGNPDEPTDEALAAALSREGLRALIAGLQSIDKQLEQA